jgi:hypothetical protein
VPTVKRDLPLSKKEMKPRCSLGLPKWQENKLHKFSAKKLKEKGLAWISKRSFQTHKDNAQASSAVKVKERRRFKKQLQYWRFAPNHQNHRSWHHPYSLPIPMWNSSPGMYGYPSNFYFDP